MGCTDYSVECDTLHTVCEGCGRCQHCGCECVETDELELRDISDREA
jgi:hypothetical protein